MVRRHWLRYNAGEGERERESEKHVEKEWKIPYQSETHFSQPNIKDDKTKTKIKSSKAYTEHRRELRQKEIAKSSFFRVIRVQLVVQWILSQAFVWIYKISKNILSKTAYGWVKRTRQMASSSSIGRNIATLPIIQTESWQKYHEHRNNLLWFVWVCRQQSLPLKDSENKEQLIYLLLCICFPYDFFFFLLLLLNCYVSCAISTSQNNPTARITLSFFQFFSFLYFMR